MIEDHHENCYGPRETANRRGCFSSRLRPELRARIIHDSKRIARKHPRSKYFNVAAPSWPEREIIQTEEHEEQHEATAYICINAFRWKLFTTLRPSSRSRCYRVYDISNGASKQCGRSRIRRACVHPVCACDRHAQQLETRALHFSPGCYSKISSESIAAITW